MKKRISEHKNESKKDEPKSELARHGRDIVRDIDGLQYVYKESPSLIAHDR